MKGMIPLEPEHGIARWRGRSVEPGAMILVRGKVPDWLDIERGRTFPDYNALVVEMADDDSIFYCAIMKEDGSIWNAYKKNIIEVTAEKSQ